MKKLDGKKQIRQLHVDLREAKLNEKDKILFTNSILVALNSDRGFINRYESYQKNETCRELMDDVCSVIMYEMPKVSCETSVLEEIIVRLNTIYETHFANRPPEAEYSLQYFVSHIHSVVHNRCLSDQSNSFDAVGVLYHEFIHYSTGNRTSLGIVLTPTYVADFMSELVNIDSRSHVLDICCGCGSLLSSAYRKSQASPSAQQDRLFVGCELDADAFYASLMSMSIQKNQDGLVFHGDCFSPEVISKLKRWRFTHALLNPPYSQKQQNEFMFMDLALEMLERGGKLAVICPSGCASGLKLKKERKHIMQRHTLKAVFSLPDNVFLGNGAYINTCIMVWEAHKPHDPSQLTYFGYCRSNYSRKTSEAEWTKHSDAWLQLYRDKAVVEGKSAMHCVNDEDEWLCEAYMNTDYSQLTEKDFEQTMLEYLAYNIMTHGATNQT